jgi:hypothetical protein
MFVSLTRMSIKESSKNKEKKSNSLAVFGKGCVGPDGLVNGTIGMWAKWLLCHTTLFSGSSSDVKSDVAGVDTGETDMSSEFTSEISTLS